MSLIESKHKPTVHKQPQQTPLAQDLRIHLIRNVSKYPSLYKNEFLRTPFLSRHEKQHMWDKIAKDSGFEKTEDAKCKWRSLINYLRQHLENVAQRKIRRYIPITDNPDDKYVQFSDWSFYCELEFVVPYVKYAASKQCSSGTNRLEISPNEIDLIIEGIVAEADKKNEQEQASQSDLEQLENREENERVDDLTEDDILKEYFENMLKSAIKLPRFHQNRVKQILMNTVNEQNAFNKIN